MFLKKKKKEEISGHSLSIAIMYLTKAIEGLETELSIYPSSDSNFGNWAIIHDIDCLKSVIKYLKQ